MFKCVAIIYSHASLIILQKSNTAFSIIHLYDYFALQSEDINITIVPTKQQPYNISTSLDQERYKVV